MVYSEIDELCYKIAFHCKSLKAIETELSERDLSILPRFQSAIKKNMIVEHKFSQSLYSAITDSAVSPVLMFATLMEVVKFSTTSLVLFSSGLVVFSLLLGAVGFLAVYTDLKQETNKFEDEVNFRGLKVVCINWLMLRSQQTPNEIINLSLEEIYLSKDKKEKYPKSTVAKLNEVTKAALLISSTIFQVYYLTACSVLEVISASSAALLLSPQILMITGVASILFGAYFGYKFYQSENVKAVRESSLLGLDELFEKKYSEIEKVIPSEKSCNKVHKSDNIFASKIKLNRFFTRKKSRAKELPPQLREHVNLMTFHVHSI